MDIDFSVLAPDEILEPFRKELGSGLDILLRSGIIGKEVDNIRSSRRDLFCEEVHLVQEEYQAGLFKVLAVSDRLEEHEGFMHLVL